MDTHHIVNSIIFQIIVLFNPNGGGLFVNESASVILRYFHSICFQTNGNI